MEQMKHEIDALDSDHDYLDKFIHDNGFTHKIENSKINEDEVALKIIDVVRMNE